MLATRLATGLTLVAVLLAVLILDERLAPWYPLWFLASLVVMVLCAMETDQSCSGPRAPVLRGNTVIGGH